MSAEFISDELRAFWEFGGKLRNGAAVPRRADFDLMEIHSLSPKIVLLDIQGNPPRYMNRFVGTNIVALFGETTGKYVDEVDLGEFKEQHLELYRKTIETTVPHWSLAQVVRTESVAGIVEYPKQFSYERLVYPLAGEDGTIAHLAGIVIGRSVEDAKEGFVSAAVPWPD